MHNRNIWVTSDTHFQHSSILKFVNEVGVKERPEFSSSDEMDECIIERHNSVVKPGDIFYHLGDVIMGERSNLMRIINRLNGRKRLIVGNHDDIKYICASGAFQKVQLIRKFHDHGLIFSHIPIHPDGLWDFKNKRPMANVHGHIHRRFVMDGDKPDPRYKNVCVEMNNYTPVNIEEMRIYK